jgi:hypothetical protein
MHRTIAAVRSVPSSLQYAPLSGRAEGALRALLVPMVAKQHPTIIDTTPIIEANATCHHWVGS